jgi:hypothetical protein
VVSLWWIGGEIVVLACTIFGLKIFLDFEIYFFVGVEAALPSRRVGV